MNVTSLLCGVVVTYHPDASVRENVQAMIDECGRVVVVDNGSSEDAQRELAELRGVELIALGKNLGVAAALNIGGRRAAERGCRWVVTFDQDSRPQHGMVAALKIAAERHPRAAVVVPRIVEEGVGGGAYRWVRSHPFIPGFFRRMECDTVDLPAVTVAVTSGSLVEIETWSQLGGFDESLFIDYVDIDYCLKIVRAQRLIAVAAGAELIHKLGARQTGMLLGHEFRPTHHPAFRHYYMTRNRVRVWRRHACRVPHWALFDLCFATYNLLRVLALESQKWAKIKAMVLGTWDGLKGRSGACPVERWRLFSETGRDR